MNHRMRRRSFCVTLLAGCAAPGLARSQAGMPLEVGVLPNISARALLAQYQPMRDYLARGLERTVQVSTAASWTAFHRRTMALEYDVVVTAVNLARVAQVDGGFVPLLSYAPNIKGIVISANARPLKKIAELRGQTLVLSNPQSLLTLRGLQWLAENGLQRDKDYNIINTPADDSVGSVVFRGDACAAMLSGGEFRAIPDAIKTQLQVLTTFAEVPGFVVIASPRLPTSDTHAIKAHLRRFVSDSCEGKTFFANSGFSDIREPAAGLMESMDIYLEATRAIMANAG